MNEYGYYASEFMTEEEIKRGRNLGPCCVYKGLCEDTLFSDMVDYRFRDAESARRVASEFRAYFGWEDEG